MKAMEFLNHYFVVVETDEKTYSIPQLFDIALQWEKEHPGWEKMFRAEDPFADFTKIEGTA